MRELLGIASLAGFLALGCDASNPVAPGSLDDAAPATKYTITLSPESSRIFAGDTAPLRITVKVVRNADGQSADDGLTLSVSTDLGHFGADRTGALLSLLSLVLENGEVVFDFFAGDEAGTAQILARLDDSVGRYLLQVVDPGDPPKAAFEAVPNGLEVIFTDASTGSPTSWNWDFGDGTTSSDQNPVHTFPRDDVYRVKLTVTDVLLRRSSVQQFVEVASTLSADFEFEVADQTALFTDTSSGFPTGYAWDFGDPDSEPDNTSSERNPTHTFSRPGTYLVSLRVTKGTAASEVKKFVTTAADERVADFEFELVGNCAFQFTDASTGNPEEWAWDFGDGTSTSTFQNPVHIFSSSGTFVVTLKVSYADGETRTAQKVVVVPSGCP